MVEVRWEKESPKGRKKNDRKRSKETEPDEKISALKSRRKKPM